MQNIIYILACKPNACHEGMEITRAGDFSLGPGY